MTGPLEQLADQWDEGLSGSPEETCAMRACAAQLREALRAQVEAAPTCETCRHWVKIERSQQCPYTYGRCTRMQDEDYPYPHEPIVVYVDAAPYWVWTMPTASCSMHALAQADAADAG